MCDCHQLSGNGARSGLENGLIGEVGAITNSHSPRAASTASSTNASCSSRAQKNREIGQDSKIDGISENAIRQSESCKSCESCGEVQMQVKALPTGTG